MCIVSGNARAFAPQLRHRENNNMCECTPPTQMNTLIGLRCMGFRLTPASNTEGHAHMCACAGRASACILTKGHRHRYGGHSPHLFMHAVNQFDTRTACMCIGNSLQMHMRRRVGSSSGCSWRAINRHVCFPQGSHGHG